ncbi:MAG: class D sortase [Oscillospiraceae bacterium]|jgi:sortase A|nr:class D sortase [Oscillospiraceae bacterium]
MTKGKRVKTPRRRRKPTAVQIAARCLIGAGASLMLFAGVYEAANYPWQIYFKQQDEFNSYEALPDPTPPVFAPDAAPPPPAASFEPGSDPPEDEELSLPGEENLSDFGDGVDMSVQQTVLGILKIPKLGTSVNIIAGTRQSQLVWGAGHVNGSPMPDQLGNVCIAGHRVTARMHPFRHLELMAPGDYVFVQYQEHVYTYETISTFVVSNTDISVMHTVSEEPRLLTLITCHPPGSARQRLILRGRLILVDDRPAAEYFAPPTPPPEITPDVTESPRPEETPPASDLDPPDDSDPGASGEPPAPPEFSPIPEDQPPAEDEPPAEEEPPLPPADVTEG